MHRRTAVSTPNDRIKISDIRALPEQWEAKELPPQTLRRKFPHDLWELVRNRMLMGFARYASGRRSVWQEQALMEPTNVTLTRLVSKLIQFTKTRNLEFLVDVVVYACLIWRWGDDSRLHFRAVERHEVADLKASADALAPSIVRAMETIDAPHYSGSGAAL